MKTEEQRKDEADTKPLLEEAREVAHVDLEGVSARHEKARESIKFLAGDQWDPQAKADRLREKKPLLIFPKLNQFVDNVYGSMLQQRPAITVRPDDVGAR